MVNSMNPVLVDEEFLALVEGLVGDYPAGRWAALLSVLCVMVVPGCFAPSSPDSFRAAMVEPLCASVGFRCHVRPAKVGLLALFVAYSKANTFSNKQ